MAPPPPRAPAVPPPSSATVDRDSRRTLDEIGIETVLGAMIEQKKRASEPDAFEIELPPLAYEETPRSRRVPADSDAFLKAR